MKWMLFVALTVFGLGTGCAGLRGDSEPFRSVDLDGNLTPDALSRYEREWDTLNAGGYKAKMIRMR